MASSVAAMPHESASSWRDPSRLTPPRGFVTILISSPDAAGAGGSASSPATASEPTPSTRRQILDRWTAAAAATTVTDSAAPAPADQRRVARDAELSELASAARPVAARAAVFREPSPAPSDASSTAAAAAATAPAELPPAGPRASSLIQRWREIEAVGPATPRPADPGVSAAASASASDSDTGSPRGRVGCIVKKLSGASSLPEDELDDVARSELSLSQSAPPSPAPMRDASHYPYQCPSVASAINGPRPPHLVFRTVRGRRAMEELVAAMAHRRRREVAALAESHAVSRFPHKGRIQSMLRLRLLRQRADFIYPINGRRYYSRDTDLRKANSYSQQNNGPDEQFCIDKVPAEEKSIYVSAEVLVDGSGNLWCDEQMKTKGDTCQKDCQSFCVHSQNNCEALSFASKKVSKSLESDFSNKMNQLLLIVLQKQRQQQMMDGFGGYYDECMYWRQNDEIHDAHKEASAPCSSAPVSHLGAHQQECWQHSSYGSQHHDNQNLLVSELLFNFSCGKLYSYYILYPRKWKSG
ncbi:hypothetical protein Zm00014a_042378 [Zea mays]|uniref:Uncharacterized protein n=1 Tax=Zea mays TaxID=4577 RepID=A0A3L6G2E0_MAIZE|nr:hypothetical protein Zm00014a_042378 [Zea mays]